MNNAISIEIEQQNPVSAQERLTFNWKKSPSVHKLLDTISSIIATEYVSVAKQNPKLFMNQGSVK